jgi:hypothetical protein
MQEYNEFILIEVWKKETLNLYGVDGNSAISLYVDWEKMNKKHPFEEWKKEFLRINNKQF